MIDCTNILNTLVRLDKEYNNNMSDPDMPILFSKLAVIEFCGWIEQSFDAILFDYLNDHIVDTDCRNRIRKFVNNNYGFSFDNNIYKIFSIVLGSKNWEYILGTIPERNIFDFKEILTSYSALRNIAAHTNVKVTTTNYNAPSRVISDFNKFLPAIVKIEEEIQCL